MQIIKNYFCFPFHLSSNEANKAGHLVNASEVRYKQRLNNEQCKVIFYYTANSLVTFLDQSWQCQFELLVWMGNSGEVCLFQKEIEQLCVAVLCMYLQPAGQLSISATQGIVVGTTWNYMENSNNWSERSACNQQS